MIDLNVMLSALKSDPQAREAIRREILTEDLLALPARVDARFAELAAAQAQTERRLGQLAERMDQLAERMDQLTARIDQLAERMDQLTARIDQLAERMDQLTARIAQLAERMEELAVAQGGSARQLARMGGDLARLLGAEYEAWALRTVRGVAGAIGAAPSAVHKLSAEELDAQLDSAVAAGTLPPDDAEDVARANGIYVWQPDPGAPAVYCAVEVSITAQAQDVERATTRAGWLAQMGVAARAVVLSDAVSTDAATAMATGNVAWRRVRPRHPERSLDS